MNREQERDTFYGTYTYNLGSIYCVTNLSIRYSMSIVVAPCFFPANTGESQPGRERVLGNFASILYFISARYFTKLANAFAKARDCKIQSAIAVPLISRYSARAHTYSNRLFSLSCFLFMLLPCITPLRTASRAITVD